MVGSSGQPHVLWCCRRWGHDPAVSVPGTAQPHTSAARPHNRVALGSKTWFPATGQVWAPGSTTGPVLPSADGGEKREPHRSLARALTLNAAVPTRDVWAGAVKGGLAFGPAPGSGRAALRLEGSHVAALGRTGTMHCAKPATEIGSARRFFCTLSAPCPPSCQVQGLRRAEREVSGKAVPLSADDPEEPPARSRLPA